MTSWTWQALMGVVGGSMAFAALLVPLLIAQYRRYGRLSVGRVAAALAACVYLVALIAYTLLPLPSVEEACGARTGPTVQLIPFQFVADIAKESETAGVLGSLRAWATLQVLLNIALFVPLGMLVRGVLKRGVAIATLAGLAVSFLIEATQFTGDWGLYPCGYRVADVDDLMANTAGALLGALLAPLVLGWLPGTRELEAAGPRPVTALRRWVGMAVDATLFGLLASTLNVAAAVVIGLASDADRLDDGATLLVRAGSAIVSWAVVFAVPALRGAGGSLGQRTVRIEPEWRAGEGGPWRRIARAAAVGGVYAALSFAPGALEILGASIVSTIVRIAMQAWLLVAALSPVLGDHRGLSGWITGARYDDVRLASAAPGGADDRHRALESRGPEKGAIEGEGGPMGAGPGDDGAAG